MVQVYIDDILGLVTGSTRYKKNPHYENLPFARGEKVNLIIAGESELGWNVIVNKKYVGLIYTSDVYKRLFPLSEEIGYIKTIREDGKIDVSLQPEGYENIDEFQKMIIDKLELNYGLIYLSDQSTPEEIKDELQMSKTEKSEQNDREIAVFLTKYGDLWLRERDLNPRPPGYEF